VLDECEEKRISDWNVLKTMIKDSSQVLPVLEDHEEADDTADYYGSLGEIKHEHF